MLRCCRPKGIATPIGLIALRAYGEKELLARVNAGMAMMILVAHRRLDKLIAAETQTCPPLVSQEIGVAVCSVMNDTMQETGAGPGFSR